MKRERSAQGARPADRVWPDEFFADLGHDRSAPLHSQVSDRLERAIREGALALGDLLDNEVAIARRLGVSRATAQRSIQALVEKGLLIRRRGIGTQVAQGQGTTPHGTASLYEELRRAGRVPSTRVLLHEVIPAPAHIAERLRIPEGDAVLRLRRLREADGLPVAILENHLPAAFAGIDAEKLGTRGLHRLLGAHGATVRSVDLAIGARLALARESGLLGVTPGDPLLTAERRSFSDLGRVLDCGSHLYRPDRYAFETMLVGK
jgi:DNA-binding GntR family transcriptional regulator